MNLYRVNAGSIEQAGDMAQVSPSRSFWKFRDDIAISGAFGHNPVGKWSELSKLCQTGDEAMVSKAEQLMEKLETDVQVDSSEWSSAPFGVAPLVPAYLAGMPDSMRRRIHVQSDLTPVTVWYDLTASAGIRHEDMLSRGVAALALVLKLQTIRPVDLKLTSVFDGKSVVVIDIETRPICLATLCYAMTNPLFFRRIIHALHGDSGIPVAKPSRIREHIPEIQPQDIVIPAILLRSNDDLLDKPVEWINREIHKLTKTLD